MVGTVGARGEAANSGGEANEGEEAKRGGEEVGRVVIHRQSWRYDSNGKPLEMTEVEGTAREVNAYLHQGEKQVTPGDCYQVCCWPCKKSYEYCLPCYKENVSACAKREIFTPFFKCIGVENADKKPLCCHGVIIIIPGCVCCCCCT